MRHPQVGDRIFAKGIPQFVGVELVIKSVMLGTVFARQKGRGRREDIELQDGDFDYCEPTKLTNTEKSEIIKRLVKPDYLPDVPSFRREQGVLNRLFDRYPDNEFWKSFDPGFMVKSNTWWMGGGADDLRKYFNEYSLSRRGLTKEAQPITLREDKIGEDVEVKLKPKKLTDIWK